ncbi:hypothetical protein V8G54_005600 [Vigna mungo]|uniref:Uncharacterized protein n=1 Tax=Vigna mungo TaxID=3915 RepID=A0AAQ3P1T0_VIGMU
MTISTTGVPPTPNPAYQTWRRQDRLIYGAFLTTLSLEVASLLKQHLHTASKGTQSITTYMHSLKQTTDLLASLGSPVSFEDMNDHVLCGLNDGYRAVIDVINARDTPILFYDLLEKLFIQELSFFTAQRQVPTPMTALNAQTRPNHYDKTRSGQFSASSTSRPGNRKPFLGRC